MGMVGTLGSGENEHQDLKPQTTGIGNWLCRLQQRAPHGDEVFDAHGTTLEQPKGEDRHRRQRFRLTLVSCLAGLVRERGNDGKSQPKRNKILGDLYRFHEGHALLLERAWRLWRGPQRKIKGKQFAQALSGGNDKKDILYKHANKCLRKVSLFEWAGLLGGLLLHDTSAPRA